MTRPVISAAPLGRLPAPETAWRAVRDRDPRFDGRFVYGVSSTGVFCRPSCASRRPRRDRVRFFADASAAREAGFRACKRCHPESGAQSRRDAAVSAAVEYLQANAERAVTLVALAAHVGLSPYHLQRAFTAAVGVSPAAYRDALRHRRFVERLRAGDTVSRATYEAGFGSSSRVYGRPEVRSALTPAAFRQRAQGRRIQFVTAAVPLGRLLVAFTDDGVCAVELGDDDATLERRLRAHFANAEIAHAAGGANAWVRAIAQQSGGRAPGTVVPLDVQGTAFQWKVWRALQRIPLGETRTYADVAADIGKPSAVRAVASACARNPVALAVPCHRVVRSDGGLGGYRWGTERKRRLLDAERTAATRNSKAR
ncbi:MAG: bifunctional DNA-binding transcriptional regulator/O6-methylguanine-DNA methyltransferase Ada [Gemmatimonadota bacterium]|nr:bifunctional DNA-binding transcriptional regulator/O6-methylguanine-DNA methyltransferase Ada [Gemmatimonadota bacterium]